MELTKLDTMEKNCVESCMICGPLVGAPTHHQSWPLD